MPNSDESDIILHYSDDSEDEDDEQQLIIDDNQHQSEEETIEDKPVVEQPSLGLKISEVRSLNKPSDDLKKVSPIRIKLVSFDKLKDSSITEQPSIVRKRKISEVDEFVPPEEPFVEDGLDYIVDIKPTQLQEQMPPLEKSSNRRKSRQKPMESEFSFLEPVPGPSRPLIDYSMDAFEDGDIMSNSYDLYSNKETIRRIAFMRVEANYLLTGLGKRPITFTNNIVPDL